jgi:hypothetical protein
MDKILAIAQVIPACKGLYEDVHALLSMCPIRAKFPCVLVFMILEGSKVHSSIVQLIIMDKD